MPENLDKKTLEAYQDASLNVLQNFKNIERSLEIQSRFLKMHGVEQGIIKSIQEEQLTTQQKLSAIEINIQERLRASMEAHQRIHQLRTMGRALTAAESNELTRQLNALMDHRDTIKSMSQEYAKLSAERSRGYVADALGFSKLKESFSEYSRLWSKGGPILVGITLAVSLFKFILDVFNEIDKAAADFRKSMGITREFTGIIDKDTRDIHFTLGAVGVTARNVYESVQAMADAFGTTLVSSKSVSETMSLMSQQLGITSASSAEFLKNMSSVAGSTSKMQENMLLFTARLSRAAGTNLDDVMKDISSATKSHFAFMSRSPIEIAKAAVEAKRLGTSLSSAASSAEKLIDFTSSVRSEMEASVLLGQSINLQTARELAYRKDIKGLNSEILRIAKETSFEQLDPFQQRAVAEALGKSADEVGRILQADREMQKIRQSSDPEIRKQLKIYEDLTRATAKRAELEAKSEKHTLMIKNNSARIESIQQSWKALTQRVAEIFLPIIDTVLGGIANTLNWINLNTNKWVAGIAAGIVLVGGLAAIFFGLGKFFAGIGAGIGKGLGGFLQGTASGLKAMGNPSVLRGVFSVLALSAALIPFAFAMKLMNGVEWKTFFIAAAGITALAIGAAVLGPILPLIGLGALAIAALGASLIPFSAAMWIASKAIQNFANGFQIVVNGFKDLQSLSLAGTIIQVVSLTSALKDLAIAINSIPDVKFDKLRDISVGFNNASTEGVRNNKSEQPDTFKLIYDEICALRKDMLNGGISSVVYLDSQLLSSQTDRTTKFKNGYGVNNPRIT